MSENITDKKLRDIVNKLIETKGINQAAEYISGGDYSKDLKRRAMEMITGNPNLDSLMAENGDVDDFF